MSAHAIQLAVGISGAQFPRNIDPNEALHFFPWWAYLFVLVIYSAFVFGGEISQNGPLIFSKSNARSATQILAAHAAFLTILYCILGILSVAISLLPYWMTDTFNLGRGSRWSLMDLLVLLAAVGLVYIERRWLYQKSASDQEIETPASTTNDK